MDPVETYARDVIDGRVPAGKYHRLACARHLADLRRQRTPGFPYRFDWPQADRFLRFSRLMKHYKGRQFAGQPFAPTPFQVFRLGCIFGWRHADNGLRRFTTAYNELPRKQGKSFEAALVAVYVTFFEGEPGAEGYCLATKEKQARIVFDAAKKMVKASGLSDRITIFAKNLHSAAKEQKLEPLGSDSETTDGLNPHLLVTDELHAFKNRGLLDVVESATGARLNPLHFQITTAGNDPVSVCGDQHDYACKILDGVLEDDASTVSFFACIAHADLDDDWLSEGTWRKANPHWGISVNPDDMRKLAAKAQNMPAAAAEFKQKRLNLWLNASNPCLSLEGWRRGQTDWTADDMRGERCFIGVDLASKIDLMAMSCVFPPTPARKSWRLLQRIWTPADTLADRAHRDRAPYQVWVDQHWLTAVPGKTLDPDLIREPLKAFAQMFTIAGIGYDPWHAVPTMKRLVSEDGFDENLIVEVPQTYAGTSAAEGEFQADVLGALVDAGKCPVTAWAASNVVNQPDGKDNVFFSKKRSRSRIDPIKSATTAVAVFQRTTDTGETTSQAAKDFAERGLFL